MQGDPDVLKLLNEQLTSELTAINQYFLHSKMQANWGFTEIAEHTRKESFEEMQHAEDITDRILILDGLPNYQRLFPLRVGQTLRERVVASQLAQLSAAVEIGPRIANVSEDRVPSDDIRRGPGRSHPFQFRIVVDGLLQPLAHSGRVGFDPFADLLVGKIAELHDPTARLGRQLPGLFHHQATCQFSGRSAAHWRQLVAFCRRGGFRVERSEKGEG